MEDVSTKRSPGMKFPYEIENSSQLAGPARLIHKTGPKLKRKTRSVQSVSKKTLKPRVKYSFQLISPDCP